MLIAVALVVSGLVPMARSALAASSAAMAVLRDPDASEEAKEAAARQSSVQLFGAFFGLLWRTVAALAVSAAPIALAHVTGLADGGTVLAFLARWDVITVSTVVLIGLWMAVARYAGPAAPGYGTADRVLHRAALDGRVLPEVLHDMERGAFLSKAPQARDGAHVFVCGLARAGTTVLTRDLFGTGAFGSLTYRDMPLVLAPNLWRGLSRSSSVARQERAHGDGLEVDLDSPEALDEVFWRVIDGDRYIRSDRLVPHRPEAEDTARYIDLIRLVLLKTGKTRYLSKNNNTILRLPALSAALPNARFVVPLREPLDHAASLLRQHRRFGDSAPFEARYIAWLGHHEFGSTHRPFAFGAVPEGTPDQPDYWLRLVLATTEYLLSMQDNPAIRYVLHDRLCAEPDYRRALFDELGLPDAGGEMRVMPPADLPDFDPALVTQARTLYDRMRAAA